MVKVYILRSSVPAGGFLKEGIAVDLTIKHVNNEKLFMLLICIRGQYLHQRDRWHGLEKLCNHPIETSVKRIKELWVFDPELRIFSNLIFRKTANLLNLNEVARSNTRTSFWQMLSWTSGKHNFGEFQSDGMVTKTYIWRGKDYIGVICATWERLCINKRISTGGLKNRGVNARSSKLISSKDQNEGKRG